jgi:meso-butanediol dehydrogenase / (S,S)-butanediol dehydrogenase / diacetyl reductase
LKLKGKVAVVTGGGAGIGHGIIRCLAEEGADIAVVDVNSTNAQKAAAEIKMSGVKSLAFTANVTESTDVERLLSQVLTAFGRIDILVNNVGGESRFYFEKPGQPYTEEQEWDDTVKLNLKASMLMCHSLMSYFIKQKSGKIVNISSVGGRAQLGTGNRGGGPGPSGFGPMMSYCVSKAGLIQFSRMLALQLAPYNINVNCICPGVLYTPLYERSFERRQQMTPGSEGLSPREFFDKYVIKPQVPLQREQTPEDIGRTVVFFVSEESRNITGQAINVDGGMYPS